MNPYSERVGLDSIVETVAFYHELIRNADVAGSFSPPSSPPAPPPSS
jgi:hypothetical protein